MKEIVDSSKDNSKSSSGEVVDRLEKKIAILKNRLERRKKEIRELEDKNYSLRQKLSAAQDNGVTEPVSNPETHENELDKEEAEDPIIESIGSEDAVNRESEDCVVFSGPNENLQEEQEEFNSNEPSSNESNEGFLNNSFEEDELDSGNGELENDDIIIID